MADEVLGNIIIIRDILADFKKRLTTFAKVEKSLIDSEIFLNIQITDLTEDFQRAKQLHSVILANGKEDMEMFVNYKNEKVYQAIQNIFFKHSTNLHEMLKIVTKSEQHDITFSDVSNEAFRRINLNSNISNTACTYDLSLSYIHGSVPTFEGKYDKWPDFMDLYVSNVHENPTLTDAAKLRILQSLLKDDALKVIKREFGNARSKEYEQIWKKLCDRYNHKRTIIYSYLTALVFQPTLERESANNIKSLYDTTYDSVCSLKSLGMKCDEWGDLLLFIIYSKLPFKTKEAWNEKQSGSDALPDFPDFLMFLERRFRTLESLETTKNDFSSFTNKKIQSVKRFSTLQSTQSSQPSKNFSESQPSGKYLCRCCSKGSHSIRKCFKFQKLKVQERVDLIKTIAYCSNCLSFSHSVNDCSSERRCGHCKEKHNSLLCLNSNRSRDQDRINLVSPADNTVNSTIAIDPSAIQSTSDGRFSRIATNTFATLVSASEETQSVVFPTALVRVAGQGGKEVVLRAMVDACSDASYITEGAAKSLGLPVEKTSVQISGLGNNVTSESKGITSFKIKSLCNKVFSKTVNAYILATISPDRPVRSFEIHTLKSYSICLADPTFNKNAKIDILLGGEIDSAIHKKGSLKLENIVFRETQLGWIASGTVIVTQPQMDCFASVGKCESLKTVLNSLDETLKQFWEIEEMHKCRSLTEEERQCEEIYNATTIRLPSGNYCVSLPFKRQVDGFTNMRKIALARFSLLENRFSKNIKLRNEYFECLQEYIELNHMSEVNPTNFPHGYYIPHHCVIKEASSTTKLRVVFDASAKDLEGHSLNENIMNGPRLQQELLDHLLRFRFFKIAFTSDVAKMYRQILINPNDKKFQLILWRPDPQGEIKTFSLNTVTFGTTSAPYLAVKTLIQLSEDEKLRFPRGSKCLKNGFYIDDCIFGADSVEEALEIQYQTRSILSSAGFHLRKWSSNATAIIEAVPESDRETKDLFDFGSNSSVKTLGVQWCPSDDSFHYKLAFSKELKFTKRNVLSDIAKIFDPLGWIAPCVIRAKLLIQSLWSVKLEWDEPLSSEHTTVWKDIKHGLNNISKIIKIPRWLNTYSYGSVEIHGFSDASQKAYAGAVYVRSGDQVNLLFAKSKVAPLKRISLPRLELMGALLLAKMMNHLKHIYNLPSAQYYYWSDSQITLAWLKDEPQKRTVFVANRITEVQLLSDPKNWRYVESKSNPADLGTRGISATDLPNLELWWQGPHFLKSFDNKVYCENMGTVTLPQEDNVKVKSLKSDSLIHTFLAHRKSRIPEIASNIMQFSEDSFNKFSTLNKLVRVVAYCLRFLRSSRPTHIHISPSEYDDALVVVLKMVQEEVYSVDIQEIQSDGLSSKSDIYSLNPFVDKDKGLLRVSGRLGLAEHLNYDQRHPIILPYSHLVSKLIVSHAHLSTLHGTDQQTFMLVSQRYHIIRCKSLIKFVTNRCVKCFRQRCIAQQQLMGQLPRERITPNRPFLNCGVDFAGPFEIKKFRGRCQSHYKSYFAIFVCFSTKAVHLEVVIDLSTPAFIAAYRRFISRRGLVRNMYSDCGSNFKGAKSVITRSVSAIDTDWNQTIAKELAEFRTTWHFNPPASPHFGGLWEAGVKSVKRHLKRIVGNTKLTYDEFETILLQVEACLNSRPLCAIKNSHEVEVLTPAHFLIQEALLTIPDDNLETTNVSHLSRWTLLQKMVQQFWKVWNHEYLNTLRQRSKCRQRTNNLEINDVVILKEDNLPPNSWLLAKVVEVHPGADGIVRVVSIKTKNTILKRPVVKLCPLPIQSD